MRWTFLTGVALAASLAVASANASEDRLDSALGTMKVIGEPLLLEDGRHAGCQYTFVVLTRDRVYRHGQYLRIAGSVSVIRTSDFVDPPAQHAVNTMLKLVVNEVAISSDGRLNLTPSAPSRAYLLGENMQSHMDRLYKPRNTETPGSVTLMLDADPTMKILKEAAKSSHKIAVAFNQRGGNKDITIPIELNVTDFGLNGERTRSDEAERNFARCMGSVFRDIPSARMAE